MKEMNPEELKQLAIQDAKNFLNQHKTPETVDLVKNNTDNLHDINVEVNDSVDIGNEYAKTILKKWLERNSSAVAPAEVIQKNIINMELSNLQKSECTLICGPVKSQNLELIESFKNVYPIVGDYLSPRPQGIGECIVDVNHSNFCKFAKGPIRIYMDNLTGRPKVASKIWKNGDIRSFKHIDPLYYSKSFEVKSGRIPSTPIATLLMVLNFVPRNGVYLHGYNLSDLNAWDQQILHREGIKLCH